MGTFINAGLLFVAFVTLAICSGFVANAARLTTDLPGYSTNKDLQAGHSKLATAAVIGWITTVGILVLGILYIVFASAETMGVFNNIVIYLLLFLALTATAAVGIYSAIGATDIGNSKISKEGNDAYKDAIIAAVLGIVVFVLLLVALIVKLFHKPKKTTLESKEKGLSWLAKSVEEDPELAAEVL